MKKGKVHWPAANFKGLSAPNLYRRRRDTLNGDHNLKLKRNLSQVRIHDLITDSENDGRSRHATFNPAGQIVLETTFKNFFYERDGFIHQG
jgi:hypothetical protein